jgi:hypothetical protein
MPVLDTMKVGAPKAQDKCIISQKMMVEWSRQGGRRNSLTTLYFILRLHYAVPEPTATEIARPLD